MPVYFMYRSMDRPWLCIRCAVSPKHVVNLSVDHLLRNLHGGILNYLCNYAVFILGSGCLLFSLLELLLDIPLVLIQSIKLRKPSDANSSSRAGSSFTLISLYSYLEHSRLSCQLCCMVLQLGK